MQLTYNTQNLVGSGCWESRDGGLSDFGRDVIDEMNRCGVLVDLSHVGPKTSADAVRHSAKTGRIHPLLPDRDHGAPAQQVRRRDAGGGGAGRFHRRRDLPAVPALGRRRDDRGAMRRGLRVRDRRRRPRTRWASAPDFTQDQDVSFFEWLRSDKGHGRLLMPGTPRVPRLPEELATIEEFPQPDRRDGPPRAGPRPASARSSARTGCVFSARYGASEPS